MSVLGRWEGRGIDTWATRWRVPRLEIHKLLDSTNDRLKALAAEGAEVWTVVVAEEQVRGRGRGGKTWVSPPEMGLWMSVLLPPQDLDQTTLLPVRVGLAMARVLDALGAERGEGKGVMLKWPNDILVSGRKVGGVLCESAVGDQVVVGIGLNVRQTAEDFPVEIRKTASSLLEALGPTVQRGELAGTLIQEIRRSVLNGAGRLEPQELESYGARDALMGKRVETETEGPGVALGITPRGTLILEAPGGMLREVRSGSVKLGVR